MESEYPVGIGDVGFGEDSIIAEACNKAGLQDFGDYPFRKPMRMLLEAVEKEAQLNSIGRMAQRSRIVDILVTRLQAEDYFKRFPEILEEDIGEPLVIVGLGRTGTTMLQRLIATDPRIYSMFWWESQHPAPFPGTSFGTDIDLKDRDPDPRIAYAKEEVKAMIEGVPDLVAMHPIDAESPDEEVLLLDSSFYSITPEALVNIPTFGAWLEEQDQTSGYEYLKRMLQFLQWQKKQSGISGDRWVLKSPCHLGFIDLVFKVFPSATVIQTHRDPIATVPSWTSLVYTLRKLYSDNTDPKEVGRQWGAKMKRLIKRSMELRDQSQGRFIDIWYQDVAQDPIGQVRRIYESAGIELSPEVEKHMVKWTIDHSRDKRPPHLYTLDQFGFTEEGIKRDFQEYRERFIVGREQ